MSLNDATGKVLLVDDQRDVLDALRLLLKSGGWQSSSVTSPAGALQAVDDEFFDVVVADMNYHRDTTSGAEGLQLIKDLQAREPELPIVVMTAWASIDLAVEAMRQGARDFIEKPWDNQRLLSVVRNQAELGRALRRGQRLEAENQLLRGAGVADFIASDESMQPVLAMVDRIAATDVAVLITGEPGTGKGHLAKVIHGLSERKDGPLISINMGAVAESLFESEMFGHVRGAFTDARKGRAGRFELADGGTLFLDEIGNIPISQQPKLLRVLETGEFERVGSSRTQQSDARLISATNADLDLLMGEGGFRKDLLYRLNTVEIALPPLRKRRADVMPLAREALLRAKVQYRREVDGFTAEASQALCGYSWPGNVRELSHVVERAVLMGNADQVEIGDLALDSGSGDSPDLGNLAQMSLEDAERLLLREHLQRAGGNVTEAAQSLGLSRSAMYRRMDKYHLSSDATELD